CGSDAGENAPLPLRLPEKDAPGQNRGGGGESIHIRRAGRGPQARPFRHRNRRSAQAACRYPRLAARERGEMILRAARVIWFMFLRLWIYGWLRLTGSRQMRPRLERDFRAWSRYVLGVFGADLEISGREHLPAA